MTAARYGGLRARGAGAAGKGGCGDCAAGGGGRADGFLGVLAEVYRFRARGGLRGWLSPPELRCPRLLHSFSGELKVAFKGLILFHLVSFPRDSSAFVVFFAPAVQSISAY